jgi:hypothetical protein
VWILTFAPPTKEVVNYRPFVGNRQEKTRYFTAFWLKRLACKDVIEYILEHKTIEDFEKRIEAIEQKLDQHK